MTCTEARAAIEIADLAELQATRGSSLAEHLAECAECRALAAIVVRGTAWLSASSARRARATRAVRRVTAWSSVAAAATIVAALIVDRREPGVRPEPRLASLPVAQHVSLEVARGQQATLLKTSDPKVTVIWLSSGEGK